MRIAFVFPALNTVGGTDRVITEKANYFAEKLKYEVYIITAHQKNKPYFYPLSNKVRHIDLDVDFPKQYHRSFFSRGIMYFTLICLYRKRLEKLLNELKLDIVISAISREIDFLHKLSDGSVKLVEAHLAKEYLRDFHEMPSRGFLYSLVGKYFTWKLERAVAKFDEFVVLTKQDSNSWGRIRGSIVIPNSLTFKVNGLSECTGKTVISVGRMYDQKGYDLLIDAWSWVHSRHEDWILNIFGQGTLHDQLQDQIDRLGLGECVFLNEPVQNIADKYAESTFYVMSSRFEGFPMVLLEAMSCGLPIVSFNCPNGPSELIAEGEDGLIVENGNVDQLAEKIIYMIENEEDRIRMGKNAQRNVQRYDQKVIMGQWSQLFEKLVNEKK
jgi:glycosyltransferase involved in cell wall biosynthesis